MTHFRVPTGWLPGTLAPWPPGPLAPWRLDTLAPCPLASWPPRLLAPWLLAPCLPGLPPSFLTAQGPRTSSGRKVRSPISLRPPLLTLFSDFPFSFLDPIQPPASSLHPPPPFSLEVDGNIVHFNFIVLLHLTSLSLLFSPASLSPPRPPHTRDTIIDSDEIINSG